MASSTAIRLIAGTKSSPLGTLQLICRVRPGAAASREGVTALADDAVELCVSAPARDGEANKAVLRVLSEVSPGIPGGSGLYAQCVFTHDVGHVDTGGV